MSAGLQELSIFLILSPSRTSQSAHAAKTYVVRDKMRKMGMKGVCEVSMATSDLNRCMPKKDCLALVCFRELGALVNIQ